MGSKPMGFGIAFDTQPTRRSTPRMGREPWNDWYHVTGGTYGSWLRGDPRGWRTRHHREHVEGDYRNPPKREDYENLLAQSKSLMIPNDAVRLTPQARAIACDIFARALQFHGVDVIAIAVDAVHYHVLARFRDRNPRKWMGIASPAAPEHSPNRSTAPKEASGPSAVAPGPSRTEPTKSPPPATSSATPLRAPQRGASPSRAPNEINPSPHKAHGPQPVGSMVG